MADTGPPKDAPNAAFDPTTGFSDMQWFMFRQSNIVHYAAFSRRAYDRAALIEVARGLSALAPQLRTGFRDADSRHALPDAKLERVVALHRVADFAGFPDTAIDPGLDVIADPDLPMFRIHAYVRDGGPDENGRCSFLLVRVSHALVEGEDSALLTRSQPAAHPMSRSPEQPPPLKARAAKTLGVLAALAHLAVGNAYVPHPGPFAVVSRDYPRRLFTEMARNIGVRQRALFFALVMATIFGAGTPGGKARISATYSTIDAGGGAHRDSFMRMRMLFSSFHNAGDFAAFAQGVDAQLKASEAHESGFNAEFTVAGLHFHRGLSRLIPFAYRPQLFGFLPYDIVIGLIPPHRLAGTLTEGLMEPVWCGAATPGANACVIVPGRERVTFNFYIEEMLRPNLARLEALLPGNGVEPQASRQPAAG